MFKLDNKEWALLELIRDCLAEPATACQSFSAATPPSLLHALPAIEFMQEKWETMAKLPKYAPVVDGLNRGLVNLRKWYNNMDDTDMYLISLVLDPSIKMEYFKVHWDDEYLIRGKNILNEVVRRSSSLLSILLTYFSLINIINCEMVPLLFHMPLMRNRRSPT
jgi:hypothetical protein